MQPKISITEIFEDVEDKDCYLVETGEARVCAVILRVIKLIDDPLAIRAILGGFAKGARDGCSDSSWEHGEEYADYVEKNFLQGLDERLKTRDKDDNIRNS